MSTNANQRQTLFRFVSIRPPQLLNDAHKANKFIEFIYEGVFYSAVENRPDGESKRRALKIAAESFAYAPSVRELVQGIGNVYEVANWLAQNKSDFSPEFLYEKIQGLSSSLPILVRDLWDNLFYQVITQKDFYVKEAIIELLVFANLTNQTKDLDQIAAMRLYPVLANARTVLPLELFSDYNDPISGETALRGSEGEPIFSSKDLSQTIRIVEAESLVDRSNKAISELVVLQRDYNDLYQDEYNIYMTDYNERVQTAYDNATIVEHEKILCPSNCPEKYYTYENLDLPVFNFIPPVEVDPDILNKMTPESYYIVSMLDLTRKKTFDEIIFNIEEFIAKETQVIYSNLPPAPITTTIGNMTFRQVNSSDTNLFLNELQVPFVATFLYLVTEYQKGFLDVVLDVGYPDADVVSATFSATFPDQSTVEGTTFTDSPIGNKLKVTFFSDGLDLGGLQIEFHFEGIIVLSDGTQIELNFDYIFRKKGFTGIANIISKTASASGEPKAFVPKDFGIRRLGIADYKRVVAEVCCYREAEVAHIENLMSGEFKSKTTTRERIEETTTTVENEVEKENLTDTATSERFEMQTEVAKVVAEQKEFGAHALVYGGIGSINFETGANFASNNAKEESNRQAVTESKEITQRAMERVVSRFREEVVTKITERYKEENTHIFDNRGSGENVSGVYRYINAIYKNQIYNYGKRLMYEFMIPQPSNIHRFATEAKVNSSENVKTEEIKKPRTLAELSITDSASIKENNYMLVASEYNVNIENPPMFRLNIGKAYSGVGAQGSSSVEFNDLKVPAGYTLEKIDYQHTHRQAANRYFVATIMFGSGYYINLMAGNTYKGTYNVSTSDQFIETIPISVSGWDIGTFSLNVSATLKRTNESFHEWQIKTYDAIVKGYETKLQEYYDWLNRDREKTSNFGTNPLFYREIEKITLKRNCLSYLLKDGEMGQTYYTGDKINTYNVTRSQKMDDYASLSKFMEQAFEWDVMSYSFYPYYWGNKCKWQQLYQSENDDPIFREFMQAGMARVIVTVRPGFEDAVMHYMNFGEIWNGGQMPIIGDPLYLSIVDELKDQEYVVEETWETVVPTSLIGLQRGGVSVDADGLPCGNGCEEDTPTQFRPNDSKLRPELPPVQNN